MTITPPAVHVRRLQAELDDARAEIDRLRAELQRLRPLAKRPDGEVVWLRAYRGRSWWQPDNPTGAPIEDAWIEDPAPPGPSQPPTRDPSPPA